MPDNEEVRKAVFNHRIRLEDMKEWTWGYRYAHECMADAVKDLNILVAFAEKELDL